MKIFKLVVVLPLIAVAVVTTTIFVLKSLGSEAFFGLGDLPMQVMFYLTPLLIIIMLVYHLLYILKKRNL